MAWIKTILPVNAIKHDYQTADIAEKARAMLDFVVRVTTGAHEVMEKGYRYLA